MSPHPSNPTPTPAPGPDPEPRPAFVPTRWTLVLRARGESPEARAALGELCEAYYAPVQRFLRREGRDEDAARELTQEFFATVLAGSGFAAADPERGRFRSYLLGALKHFLADRRKHDQRLKRGSGFLHESLDAPDHTQSQGDSAHPPSRDVPDPSTPPPDAGFDREWALAVMARALDRLQAEFAQSGKETQFDLLKPWLMGDGPTLSQADAAQALDTTEGAVKVMVHRLRKRFREIVRSEIAQTLRDPNLVEEELHHLVEALA